MGTAAMTMYVLFRKGHEPIGVDPPLTKEHQDKGIYLYVVSKRHWCTWSLAEIDGVIPHMTWIVLNESSVPAEFRTWVLLHT